MDISAYKKTKIYLMFFSVFTLVVIYQSLFIGLELIIVICLAAVTLLFDLSWLNKIFKLFSDARQRKGLCVHSALEYSLKKTLRINFLYYMVKNHFFTVYYAFFAKHEPELQTDEKEYFSYFKSSHSKDIFWVVAITQLPTLPLLHLFIENQVGVLAS